MSEYLDMRGRRRLDGMKQDAIDAMSMPAECVCGHVYDLGTVEVTARYTDCSMWKAPCCGRVADDRYETGWSSVKHYDLIRKGPQR